MPERFCPSCGFALRESEIFCLRCGSKVRRLDGEADGSSSPSSAPTGEEERDKQTSANPSKRKAPDLGPTPGQPPPESMRPRTDEHDWQGKLFVGLGWVGFWFAVAGGLVAAVSLVQNGDTTVALLILAGSGGLAAFQYWFVRAVRDFDRRGYRVLVVILPLTAVGYIADMISGDLVGVLRGLVGLILTLVWFEYFLRNRKKYGVGTFKPLSP